MEHAKLLLQLYWQPAEAMGAILDRGSLLFATLAALAAGFLVPLGPVGFYAPLLALAIIYVPGLLLLGNWIGGTGGRFGAMFQRDYSALLTCTAMAWTAANLPLIAARWILPPTAFWAVAILALAYFGVLMFFAVRTVFGTGAGAAAGIVSLSWIPLVAAGFLWVPLRFLLGWIASPFFLFYAFYYLRGEFGNIGAGLRQRQNFRRMLDASAINPHDAEAQYQLGLIYQERRQYTEAIRRFTKAVEIDPRETDAHFQLGRIAREQGRLRDGIAHFQKVLDLDERHHQHEVLRELGAIYLAAKQYEDARNELKDYVERRPYDPEGLYYYGQSLDGLNRPFDARDLYQRAVEAARTAPPYRRRQTARWSRLAQKQLKR